MLKMTFTLTAAAVCTTSIAHARPATPYRCGADAFFAGAQNGPSRDWTPANTARGPGLAHGAAFHATVLRVWNEDTRFSSEMAAFRYADGCIRAFKTASFTAGNLSVLHEFRDTERGVRTIAAGQETADGTMSSAAAAALSLDPRSSHTVNFAGAMQARAAGRANLFQTQHFAFWWGNARREPGAAVITPEYMKRVGAWFEIVWANYAAVDHAPMPFAEVKDPPRINVSVYQTGLPWIHGESFANSADRMTLAPEALGFGSAVVPHEFCHVIQFYTHGYRDSPTVGEFWETHANFGAFAFEPTFGEDFPPLLATMHQGIFWPGSRYHAFPFLLQLWEKKTTNPLVFGMWTQNRRNGSGKAIEDPAETLVRLGKASGAFPDGWSSFGDEVGQYAARLVDMDFVNQKFMLSASANARKASLTKLTPSAGAAAEQRWFHSPAAKSLGQFGIAHIGLMPANGAKEISVTLRGETTSNRAGWRMTLVAVGAEDRVRYSSMARVSPGAPGSVSIEVRPGEVYTLAVAATPEQWEHVVWSSGPAPAPSKTRFPYSIELSGATPM